MMKKSRPKGGKGDVDVCVGELAFKGLRSVSMMTTVKCELSLPRLSFFSQCFYGHSNFCFPHPGIRALDPSKSPHRPPIVVPLFEAVMPWSIVCTWMGDRPSFTLVHHLRFPTS